MAIDAKPAPPRGRDDTLRAQLREALRTGIVQGRWRVDEKLPSESRLGATHRVSRITVRQALADLAADGLIVRRQGRGSFVAPAPVRQQLVRLQGLAEALAGDGRVVTTRVLALADAPMDADTARALGRPPGALGVRLRTLRLLDDAPLSLNRCWIVPAIGRRLSRFDLAARDLLSIYESDLAVRVGRAGVEISAGSADRSEHTRLCLAPHAPVLRVERTVHAADGSALHVERSTYRADAFRYRLVLER